MHILRNKPFKLVSRAYHAQLHRKERELRCKIKGDTIHVSSGATIQIVPVGLAKDANLNQTALHGRLSPKTYCY